MAWRLWLARVASLATVLGALGGALVFLVAAHLHAAQTPDRGFAVDETATVSWVEPGSPAAGLLRPGDRLLAAGRAVTAGSRASRPAAQSAATTALSDGTPARSDALPAPADTSPAGSPATPALQPVRGGFHWLLRNQEIGFAPVRLRMARAGAHLLVRLEAQPAPLWPSFGWSVGSAMVVFGLCLVLLLRRRSEPGLPGYLVALLSTFVVLYGFTHTRTLLPNPPLFLSYLFFNLFTLPLLLHQFLRYPTPVKWVARRPWLPLLLYLPQVALTLATAWRYVQLVAEPSLARQARILILGRWLIPTVFLVYLLAALGTMVVRFIYAPPERRRQIQWVIYGGVMALGLAGAFWVLRWHTAPQSWLLESSEYLLPIYALLALTVGFSVMEFRLMDVERVVHRSVVYGLLSLSIVVAYLLLTAGLGYLFVQVLGIESAPVTILATVGAAALFFPMRRAVQANIDRVFFRHRSAYEEILAQASSEFVTLLDLDRLSRQVLGMLVTKLNRRHAALLLAGADRTLRVVGTAGRALDLPEHLPTVDSFLLRKLRAHAEAGIVAAARRARRLPSERLRQELGQFFQAVEADLVVFLVTRDRIHGLLLLGPRTDGRIADRDEIEMLSALGRQLAVAVQNAAAFSEIEQLGRSLARQRQEILRLKARLEAENIYLREEVEQAARFGDIVGQSPGIRAVLDQVARVAPTEATVLILGESGTGKELVARAIHDGSPRRDGPLVTLNCAAIPEGLLESELFGHEKGAFTGAVGRKRGRFELADGGTLFFDEVGDLPLPLQGKLLRALQEREITPVGGTRPIQVDVRVVSATHRDLEERVAAGLFRQDLYYRLNVVPIQIPPLRERREDIPLLAEYFARELGRRNGKQVTGISRRAMDRLQAYSWPGNVRELANVIERAVVLSTSSLLDEEVTLPATAASPAPPGPHAVSGDSAPPSPHAASDGPGDAGSPDLPWPPDPDSPEPFHEAVQAFKRAYLRAAIQAAGGNRAEAARRLGLQRTYLYRLEHQLGLRE